VLFMLILRVLPRVTYPRKNVTSEIQNWFENWISTYLRIYRKKSHFLFSSLLGYCYQQQETCFLLLRSFILPIQCLKLISYIENTSVLRMTWNLRMLFNYINLLSSCVKALKTFWLAFSTYIFIKPHSLGA